jgi:hypothetical protein
VFADEPAGSADADGVRATGFANSFGKTLVAATTPSSLAKNCFRDELWVTGSEGKGPESLPKQGTGVSLVNQKFRRKFPMEGN